MQLDKALNLKNSRQQEHKRWNSTGRWPLEDYYRSSRAESKRYDSVTPQRTNQSILVGNGNLGRVSLQEIVFANNRGEAVTSINGYLQDSKQRSDLKRFKQATLKDEENAWAKASKMKYQKKPLTHLVDEKHEVVIQSMQKSRSTFK